jgi:large subunit ribosomal protein L29
MTTKEIRERTLEELATLERQISDELFRFKLQNYTNQLDSAMKIRGARRDLARIKTVLRERGRGKVGASALPQSALGNRE